MPLSELRLAAGSRRAGRPQSADSLKETCIRFRQSGGVFSAAILTCWIPGGGDLSPLNKIDGMGYIEKKRKGKRRNMPAPSLCIYSYIRYIAKDELQKYETNK